MPGMPPCLDLPYMTMPHNKAYKAFPMARRPQSTPEGALSPPCPQGSPTPPPDSALAHFALSYLYLSSQVGAQGRQLVAPGQIALQ